MLLLKDMSIHKTSADVVLLVLRRFANFISGVNKTGLKAKAEL
jgi:hypothetical protein